MGQRHFEGRGPNDEWIECVPACRVESMPGAMSRSVPGMAWSVGRRSRSPETSALHHCTGWGDLKQDLPPGSDDDGGE